MVRLVFARTASGAPMGAQRYEREIILRAEPALREAGHEWSLRDVVVRSMRSSLPGDRRIPLGWLSTASPSVRASAARLVYPRHDLCHRMGLDLPPSPRGDVITVHDVVPWRFPDETAPIPAAPEELSRAAAVITVSEFSADEAVEVLGIPRPHVVPNGVEQRFFDAEPAAEAQLATLGVRLPFILCAGGSTLRKNLASLAKAWPRVHQARPDLSLILSGPPSERRSQLFSPLKGTVLAGRLPDALMPGVVAAAACLVVPSLYEGFGLPALEGMAAGTPVVAARTSSLPEVVGDGGLLVAPDPDGLVEGLLAAVEGGHALTGTVEAGRRRAAHYTWERSAQAHARVWASILEGRGQ